jgi:hypothetical protein
MSEKGKIDPCEVFIGKLPEQVNDRDLDKEIKSIFKPYEVIF